MQLFIGGAIRDRRSDCTARFDDRIGKQSQDRRTVEPLLRRKPQTNPEAQVRISQGRSAIA